jgi:hypothetical protein
MDWIHWTHLNPVVGVVELSNERLCSITNREYME